MRETISIKKKTAMSLQRVGTRNTLYTIEKVDGIAETTIPKLMFFNLKKELVHLQRIFVQFPSLAWFQILARNFEDLHGIPHIIGAIDGSHIPILAPNLHR